MNCCIFSQTTRAHSKRLLWDGEALYLFQRLPDNLFIFDIPRVLFGGAIILARLLK